MWRAVRAGQSHSFAVLSVSRGVFSVALDAMFHPLLSLPLVMPKVFVTTESGSTLTFEVDLSTDTVASLKAKIRDKEGVEGNFQLSFNGDNLADENTLEACGIKPEDTLVMSPEEERIEVVVHRAGEGAGVGASILLSMRPQECVADIKRNVEESMNFPVAQQRLSMDRVQLEDDSQTVSQLQSQSSTAPSVSVMLDIRIRVTVHLYTGPVLNLELSPNERISVLHGIIFRQGHIPHHLQEVTCNGLILESGLRIDHYGVEDGATLYVALRDYHVQVFFKTLTGRTVMIPVSPRDTVGEIKVKIEAQEGIPVDRQRLIFVGEQLHDHERLLDYRIEHESAVHLVVRTGDGFQIFVRIPGGRRLVFEVHPNERVGLIKQWIQDRHGFPVDLQQLLYEGQELRDDGTYQEYNIQNNATLDVVHDNNRNTQIFVSLPSRDSVTVWANTDDTVEALKEIIERKTEIAAELQDLYFAREKLANERTLRSYWIEENHMLHLDIVRPPILHFSVRLQDGTTLSLEEPANQTVQGVKRAISLNERIPVRTQQLFLAGSELEDDAKLSDCEIRDGSLLDLITTDTALTTTKLDIDLFVKTLTGKTLILNVTPSDKIVDLKRQIQEKEGIQVDHQCLVAAGRPLDNDLELSTCNVQNQSVIHLVLRIPSQGPVRLLVTTQNGQDFHLQGSLADTVEDLKAQIEEVGGIPQASQVLLFGDVGLDESERTLGSYNIKEGATLQLIVAEN